MSNKNLKRSDLKNLPGEVYDVLLAKNKPMGFSQLLEELHTTPRALSVALTNLRGLGVVQMYDGLWVLLRRL